MSSYYVLAMSNSTQHWLYISNSSAISFVINDKLMFNYQLIVGNVILKGLDCVAFLRTSSEAY